LVKIQMSTLASFQTGSEEQAVGVAAEGQVAAALDGEGVDAAAGEQGRREGCRRELVHWVSLPWSRRWCHAAL
jgi:hypothetical protein